MQQIFLCLFYSLKLYCIHIFPIVFWLKSLGFSMNKTLSRCWCGTSDNQVDRRNPQVTREDVGESKDGRRSRARQDQHTCQVAGGGKRRGLQARRGMLAEEGPLGIGGQGEGAWHSLAHPLNPREPAETPGLVLHTLRPEALQRPLPGWGEPGPCPPTHPRPFWWHGS